MSWISRVFALVLMSGALAATGAHAQVITPNPTTFTTVGIMNFDGGASCDIAMTFSVPAGGASASVTSATVTGGSGCDQFTFVGTPWNVRVAPGMLYIDNFEMLLGPLHPTGKQTISVYWTNPSAGYSGGGIFTDVVSYYGVLGYLGVTSPAPVAIN
ncbi:hypothetical protein CFHF_07495 [Caulobacter flavus]|uniref:Protein activator of alkane oxidation PraB n=1 Tax=Caulobacter flavus TaxID=1679497 RepID=A0A2N5CWH5_9CAUL|nr:hypothetical protein [Caulobacter flavus]AYV44842.1 hypothetical protein C1707_00390 [Caulobacter flavus]PLR18154.1 hypothetical protein CFHF_07495 [Caulobacter flavus]